MTVTETHKEVEEAGKLLQRAMRSPNDQSVLSLVGERAPSIIEFLESEHADEMMASEAEALDPVWLAEIYVVLAGDAVLAEEDKYVEESLFRALVEEEKDVGRAFEEVLCPSIVDSLNELKLQPFRDAKFIDDAQFDWLRKQVCVEAGGEYAKILAHFGITPMTIVEATEAVSNVVSRHCDKTGVTECRIVSTIDNDATDNQAPRDGLDRKHVVTEIMLMTELDEATSGALFDFLNGIAAYVPSLFNKFTAESDGADLKLIHTGKVIDDLFERWRGRLESNPTEGLYKRFDDTVEMTG